MSDRDMLGFVYVATANELIRDDICKIGVATNMQSRFAAHEKHPSAHYKLFCFACYRFDSFADAQEVETWVKRELRRQKRQYSDKADFFHVRPSMMCTAIRDATERLKLSAIEEFPMDLEGTFEWSGDFFSLPEQLLACLTPNEARAYWQGVKDVCLVLAKLEGIKIAREDFSYLWQSMDFNMRYNAPSAAETITLYFRNHHDPQVNEIAERAARETVRPDADEFSILPGEWYVEDGRRRLKA
jgi:predicted GIY-YIG superfamily endonuclease